MLGSSKCKEMSVLDLKDAFYSLRLTESSKKYCGILPYFGSTSHLYQRITYEPKHIPSGMAIIHKCNPKLSVQKKILWGKNG